MGARRLFHPSFDHDLVLAELLHHADQYLKGDKNLEYVTAHHVLVPLLAVSVGPLRLLGLQGYPFRAPCLRTFFFLAFSHAPRLLQDLQM
jgi:hypothetical protein